MTDFTMELRLCDDDGIVRRGAMHHGTDYPCTGSAHFAGEHIRCISPGHPGNLSAELLELIRNPGLTMDCPVCAAPPSVICGHGLSRDRLAFRFLVEGRV